MQSRKGFLVLFIAILTGACASSGKIMSTERNSSVTGIWNYGIDSPEGLFTGTLIVAAGDTGLNISVLGEGEESPVQAEDVEFDVETQTLSFSFEDPDYGMLEVSLVLGEEGMDGVLHAVRYGVDSPMTAARSEQ